MLLTTMMANDVSEIDQLPLRDGVKERLLGGNAEDLLERVTPFAGRGRQRN